MTFSVSLRSTVKHPDMIKILLEAGADPNLINNWMNTLDSPLRFAISGAETGKELIANRYDTEPSWINLMDPALAEEYWNSQMAEKIELLQSTKLLLLYGAKVDYGEYYITSGEIII